MYRHLPPLNALRSFEAAARHLSFTKAAEELFVTQGAISRQVRKLEDYLGGKLFIRETNSIELTDFARLILPSASLAFENISNSIEAARGARSVVRLQAAPTFAIRWLMPRLAGFTEQHPNITVRPSITLHPENFDDMSFDAGIIYGGGSWEGLHSTLLSEEILVPVCAPAFQDAHGSISTAPDLNRHTLLHTTIDRRDWPLWLDHEKVSGVDGHAGPAFETLDMAVRAAEAGHGVALGDLSLISEDIDAGSLVIPVDRRLATGRGCYFVCRAEDKDKRSLALFRDWLLNIAPVAKDQ